MLTDADCKHASCPDGLKRLRLSDAAGLYLEVSPGGSKRWFWRYYPDGKEKRLALGSYPGASLKAAREARDDARKLHRSGTDPVQKRRADKIQKATASDTTFEAVARDLHATKKSGWSEVHAKHWLRAMEKDLFPWIGSLALPDVTAPILLHALRKIEARGAINTAHDAREFSGQVFMYGIATGRCERNVAADLRGALKPLAVKHMGALTEPKRVGDLLRAIAEYQGQPITRAALQLASLLFQRPGNVRSMEWAELDLEAAAMWSIPAAKMKRRLDGKRNGRPHLVPLSTQAVVILKDELHPLTGRGRYVFPSLLSGERPMSDNTLNTALRRLGFSRDDMTAHGFRATARTIMVEKLGIDEAVIEAALAHAKSGPLKGAYDRAEFMDQRRVAAQRWADYLDALRAGGTVLPGRAVARPVQQRRRSKTDESVGRV